MTETTETIQSYEDWKASLTNEEAIKALWKRLELLQEENAALNKRVKTLEEQATSLRNMLTTHKHDKFGQTMLPAGLVNP